jgi:hypothetical protein
MTSPLIYLKIEVLLSRQNGLVDHWGSGPAIVVTMNHCTWTGDADAPVSMLLRCYPHCGQDATKSRPS